MKLFGGSAHPSLTQEVAKLLHIPIAKSELARFGNSEIKVTIQEDVRDQECVVIQTTTNPTDTHLMELFFFADALKRSEAKKIIAVIPYFGYARQNMQHRPGECVSLNVVVRFLELVGFDKVMTFDLHEEASADMFTVAFENLSAFPSLAEAMRKEYPDMTLENTVAISPDQDMGVERARLFAKHFFGNDKGAVGSVEKHRNLDAVDESKAAKIYANVEGKKVIIVDDIITSAGTMINAADLCLENGATEIYAAITHPNFIPGAKEKMIASKIKKIFVSNTIPIEDKFEKLEGVSIAHVIKEKLQS